MKKNQIIILIVASVLLGSFATYFITSAVINSKNSAFNKLESINLSSTSIGITPNKAITTESSKSNSSESITSSQQIENKFDLSTQVNKVTKQIANIPPAPIINSKQLEAKKYVKFEPKEINRFSSFDSSNASDCDLPQSGYNYNKTALGEPVTYYSSFVNESGTAQNDNIDKYLSFGNIDLFTVTKSFPYTCVNFNITKIKDLDYKVKNTDNSRSMLAKISGDYMLVTVGKKQNTYFYINSPLFPDNINEIYTKCRVGVSDFVDPICSEREKFAENVEIEITKKAKNIVTDFENSFNY
jgi:hypothetical protein